MSFSKSQILKGEDPDGKFKNIKVNIAQELKIDDLGVEELLKLLLVEMKINNFQLGIITGDNVTEKEINPQR